MMRKPTGLLLAALLPLAVAGAAIAASTDTSHGAAWAASDSVHADSASADGLPPDSTASGRLHTDSAAAALVSAPALAPAETTAAPVAASSPVLLGGREIFVVRVGRDGLDPFARAVAIRSRISQAVVDRRVPADSVQLVPGPGGIQVRLGPHFLWLITPGDVAGRDPAELAAELAQLPGAIRDGIERERVGRTPARVLINSGIALALTFLAFGAFRLLLVGSHRWRLWLTSTLAAHLPAIRLRSFEVLSKAQVGGVVTGALSRLDLVIGAALLYGYLTAVFSLFPWTQGWSSLLLTFALGQLWKVLRNIWSGLPGLFAIALIFLLFHWLSRLAARFFDSIADGTLTLAGFHPELAPPSKRLTGILLWVIAAMIAYPYIPGSGSKAVQGVSILFGLMLSLGSTGFVGNMISGIVLTYSRSFRAGERVRIADQIGDVVSLGFFATKLRTVHNEEVTIPNGQVASASIVNYTRLAEDPGLVLHTQVTIGYDVEWRKVHALLIEAASRVDGVEKAPEPWVFQRSLNDSHITYELQCITRRSHPQLRLYSDLHAEIQDAFSRAGVEILSPAYHAIRDANAPVLPGDPAGPRPEPGGFRMRGS